MRKVCRSSLFIVPVLLLAACGRGGPSVQAKPQAITFGAAPTLVLNGTATVTASASSGLPVSFSSTTPAICSVTAQGVVSATALGACVVAANQDGNSEFSPAPQATQSIAVTVNPVQSISFGVTPTLSIYGSGAVAATASSGLPVSYSSLTAAVCTVDARGVVSAQASGTCIVAADQAGNVNYFAAPQVTQTIPIPVWTGPVTVPGAPAAVSATRAVAANNAIVSFVGPASSGGSPVTGYTVSSIPAGITATGAASPLTVTCPVVCTGYAFTVSAANANGSGAASAAADVITAYSVVARFLEPATQPNDSIFTGTFTLNSTTGTVSGLKGSLTQSMVGPPMTLVPLTYQLSSVNDGAGGLLVTTFALNTTNVFSEGGFAPGSPGLYYGFPSAKNPAIGGVGNAYAMIYVNLADPLASLTAAQIGKLAYADCTALGMMGDVCMTGYVGIGTMGGYPFSQVITKQ